MVADVSGWAKGTAWLFLRLQVFGTLRLATHPTSLTLAIGFFGNIGESGAHVILFNRLLYTKQIFLAYLEVVSKLIPYSFAMYVMSLPW